MPNGPVHASVAAGTSAALSLWLGLPPEDVLVGVAVATLAGLAPDLDRPGSAASRLLWPLTYPASLLLFRLCGHRGIVHSVAFAIAVGVSAWVWLPAVVGLAVIVGWWSHLMLDAISPRGIPLVA